MPETRFHIRWPDGHEEACYSPSTVIREHLVPGPYPLGTFVAIARTALDAASERVRARFGMGCARAAAQKHQIEQTAAGFAADTSVTVLGFEP